MNGMQSARIYFLVLTSVCCFHLQTAFGDNGSVVVTSVVDDIQVDGDLSDWPDDEPWHSIGLNLYGDADTDHRDSIAQFHIGVDLDELRIFVAFKIRDESFVPEPKGNRSWTSNDSTHLYLAAPARKQDPDTIRLDRLPVAFDQVWGPYDEATQTRTCECSFDLRQPQFENLANPFSAAFSIGVHDKDADGSFTVKFWSPGISKQINPIRRGDLIVCGAARGRLKGLVESRDGKDDVGRLMIRIESVDNPMLQIDLLTNPDGSYDLELPPGSYRRTGTNLVSIKLQVQDGQVTHDAIAYQDLPVRKLRLADYDSPAKARPGFFPTLRRSPYSQQDEMNELNGLPDSRIFALEQDFQGALWIGTATNLATFDGANLRVYDRKLAKEMHGLWHDDHRKRLWLASRYEVGFISNGKLTKFPLLDNRRANCVGPTHDGRVFIGTETGAFLWNEDQFRFHSTAKGLPDEFVNAVASDKKRGVTWIGTNLGLAAFDGDNYRIYDQRHGLTDPRVISLFVDSRQRLWIGTATSLYYFDDEFVLVRKHPTEQERYARCFVELENGDLKIGAYNASITIPSTFPDDPPQFVAETRSNDAMLLDRDLQLWRGFEGGELSRVDQGLRQVHTQGPCRFLCSVGDSLWFVTQDKDKACSNAVQFNKDTLTATNEYPIKIPGTTEPVEPSSFLATEHGVWVGTKAHGVFRLIEEEWQLMKLPADSFSEISSIIEDNKRRVWIATLQKLFRVEGEQITRLDVPTLSRNGNILQVAVSPNEQLAIATDQGIFVVDEEMNLVGRHHKLEGPLSSIPRAIAFDRKGTLWLAAWSGLHAVEGNKSRRFTSSDGLLDDKPKDFVCIWGDEVWSGAEGGISRISADRDVIQHLRGFGDIANDTISSVVPDRDMMWLGGDSGIWKYRRGSFAPTPFIDNIVTTESLGPQSEISVTTDLKKFKVEFRSNSLKSRSAGIIYQHKIDGVDEKWKSTRSTELEFDVPPSGDYQLMLRAIDRDLLTSDTKTVAIQVRPPFARWASKLALIIATAASLILGLLYFARVRQQNSSLEKSVKRQTAQLSDLERQLQHAQKMKALGTLASGVAHDFNNSLLAISGNAELALLSDSEQERNELLSELLSVTDQAAGLTKSMLMFGGRSASSKENIDIRTAVKEAEKILRRTLSASIKFRCELPDEPVYCDADSSQIQQVVLNLAVNSRDAMPDGGLLMVELVGKGESATLTVRDDGHGMSRATQDRIFEPFYTEKPRGKGTGLGLSVVHAIVRDHGWELDVNSTKGNGTVFKITFPVREQGTTTTSPKITTLAQSQGKVLLADDEAQVRATLAKALRMAGFDVETAGDGIELVNRFSKSNYDLVIVDVDMPGKNGWDCVADMRKLEKDINAIIISGLPKQERRLDQRTCFVQKPFSLRDLTEKATTMIHREENGLNSKASA